MPGSRSPRRPCHPTRSFRKLVNRNRLPHVAVYESAIAKVYREEIKKAEKSRLQRDPGPAALFKAKKRVGAPFPRGEARFRIEALFETVKIRLKLVPVSQAFCDYFRFPLKPCISRSGKTTDKNVIADNFQYLAWGLLRSCRRDIDLAMILCIQAEGQRLELTACTLSLQVEYAFTRFLAQDMTAGWRLPDEQTILQAKHESLLHREWAASQALALYDRVGSIMANSPATLAWAKNVVLPVINQNEWSTFVNELKLSAFYQHVSVEEKMSIVEAVLVEHGSVGRFYQFPKGHTFTVANCGQVVDVQTCLDCGERVGGRGHRPMEGTTRDMEMERLAAEQGAARNMFAAGL